MPDRSHKPESLKRSGTNILPPQPPRHEAPPQRRRIFPTLMILYPPLQLYIRIHYQMTIGNTRIARFTLTQKQLRHLQLVTTSLRLATPLLIY